MHLKYDVVVVVVVSREYLNTLFFISVLWPPVHIPNLSVPSRHYHCATNIHDIKHDHDDEDRRNANKVVIYKLNKRAHFRVLRQFFARFLYGFGLEREGPREGYLGNFPY